MKKAAVADRAAPTPLQLRAAGGAVRLSVHVRPNASKSRIMGVREQLLEVAVAAPAHDGKANDELCRLLARLLGIPPTSVQVVRGQRGRHKLIELVSCELTFVSSRLGELLATTLAETAPRNTKQRP
jgi:uncharacterized protein